MRRGHFICIFALLLGMLFMFIQESQAAILVKDDTIIFTPDSPKIRKDKQRIEKVIQFEKETKYEKPKDLSDVNDFTINPGAVDRVIGKKFVVSKDKKFAVILSYSCTQMVYAAENPWKCNAIALIVDSEGYKMNEIKGDFLWVEIHSRLPYFALIEDFCCATRGKSSLYTLDGEKICESYLSPGDNDCGNLFANCNWRDKTEFTCEGETLDETFIVNLEARLIDGPANIREKPKGKIIGSLSDNTKVHVLDQRGDWFLIEGDSLKGWTYKGNFKNGFVSLVKKQDLPKDKMERLILFVRDPNESIRRKAAKDLGSLAETGDERAINALIDAARSNDELIQITAFNELRHVENPLVIKPLIALLSDEDSNIRRYALFALGGRKDPTALEALLNALSDEDGSIRRAAINSLRHIENPRAVEPLITALSDSESGVRVHAVVALGEIGDRRAIGPLIGALDDEDSEVRRVAASVLGRFRDPRAVKHIVPLLRDEVSAVRGYAASALGGIGDMRAVEPLIETLKDRDSDVRNRAAWSLRCITKQNFGEDDEKWRRWWEENRLQP